MAIRKDETFEPVTMGHVRSHGCRDLLVYRLAWATKAHEEELCR